MILNAWQKTVSCVITLLLVTYIGLGISQLLGGIVAGMIVPKPPNIRLSELSYSSNGIVGDLICSLIYGFLTTFVIGSLTGKKFRSRTYVTNSLTISFAVAIFLGATHFFESALDRNNRIVLPLVMFSFSGGVLGFLKSRLLTSQATKCQSKMVWIVATGLGWAVSGVGAFVFLLFLLPLQR